MPVNKCLCLFVYIMYERKGAQLVLSLLYISISQVAQWDPHNVHIRNLRCSIHDGTRYCACRQNLRSENFVVIFNLCRSDSPPRPVIHVLADYRYTGAIGAIVWLRCPVTAPYHGSTNKSRRPPIILYELTGMFSSQCAYVAPAASASHYLGCLSKY